MKCPCCGGDSNASILVYHNTIHMADGTTHRISLGSARILKKLLEGRVVVRELNIKQNSGSFDVHLAHLREAIEDLGLPFKIIYTSSNRTYNLVWKTP